MSRGTKPHVLLNTPWYMPWYTGEDIELHQSSALFGVILSSAIIHDTFKKLAKPWPRQTFLIVFRGRKWLAPAVLPDDEKDGVGRRNVEARG